MKPVVLVIVSKLEKKMSRFFLILFHSLVEKCSENVKTYINEKPKRTASSTPFFIPDCIAIPLQFNFIFVTNQL